MTEQLSKHRHISFTAHYTGYIWYQMGISHPNFATQKGQLLARLLHPLECFAEKFVGGSMRTTLKQRHELLDQELERLLQQHPQLQVLEIASGLSPRGWWFRENYPDIHYVELDLPDMANVKRDALANLQPDAQVIGADLFSPELDRIFHQFDTNEPLVIISEGLINYFALNHLKELLSNLVRHTQQFPQFYYLTDIYPEPTQHRLASFIWQSSKLLKVMSRSAFTFHFKTPQALNDYFQQCGFNDIQLLQPKNELEDLEDLPITEQQHRGDLVWVVKAERNKTNVQ